MNIRPGLELYGVIGDPVAHSLSPAIHNALFQAHGLNKLYLPLPVKPGEIGKLFAVAQIFNLKGLNVTMPHKKAVMEFLDEIHPDARLGGAVNTVVIGSEKISGCSTDAPGLHRAVRRAGFSFRGAHILMVGAGAVSKPIAIEIAKSGAAELLICNRTMHKAENLADFLRKTLRFPARAVPFLKDSLHSETYDMVLNTSAMGMAGCGEFPDLTFLNRLPNDALVCDLVYHPAETALLRYAKNRGLPTMNGLPMLVHQALLAFTYFTGIETDETDIQTVLSALGKA